MSERDRFAEVAVDAPAGHDRTFSYALPEGMEASPGQLVVVPFGPRQVQGIVFELADRPQVDAVRPILSVEESAPVLPEVHLRLARWLSQYYACSLFEAAAPMLPPGGRFRIKSYFEAVLEPTTPAELPPYRQRVLDLIRQEGPVEEGRLRRALGEHATTAARRLEDAGLVTRTFARTRPSQQAKMRDYVQLPAGAAPRLRREIDDLTGRAPKQRAALELMLERGSPMLLADANKEFGSSAIAALVKKGALERAVRPEERDPLAGRTFPKRPDVRLTPMQRRASSAIERALGSGAVFLLEGVTGSGKTEVYLEAAQQCIRRGRGVIIMVPEIALTPQTIERFASRFPRNIAVLHSGLTDGERFDQWWKVRQGDYKVVVGSRSAVFAPLQDVGLIVVDEEHEWTYKQHDSVPRYHARTAALQLAELTGAAVVLGSASPDVQSYRRALSGRVKLLRLPYRVLDEAGSEAAPRHRGLAAVQVVDMRDELRSGNRHIFSRALQGALARSIESGNQAVLFLNRRGTSPYFQCRHCGSAVQCRRCDVPVTYHRDRDRLLCHYCGESRRAPDMCPECGHRRLAFYGIGTKAVADEVSSLHPGAPVARWDRDAVRSARDYEEALEEFRSGEARVLVGTQMIAKGLHFPSVDLVGVVLADVGLMVPDFRAGERTFQLIHQVAGRSGRGATDGRVIIQTYQPENYAIRAAAAQDYRRFYEEETERRREQGNPPFSRLIRLAYAHVNRARAEGEAKKFADALLAEREAWGLSEVDLLGPTPAFPERVRGHYRWQLVLRAPRPRDLLDKVRVPRDWTIDVDPAGFS